MRIHGWLLSLSMVLAAACASAEDPAAELDVGDDVVWTTEESTSDRVCSYTTSPCGAHNLCFFECTGTTCNSGGMCFHYTEIGCYVCGSEPTEGPPPRDPRPPFET